MELISGRPCLKKKHKYFYQCQGVIAITQTKVMDFIIYTNKENVYLGIQHLITFVGKKICYQL